jgi:hypothetical protein
MKTWLFLLVLMGHMMWGLLFFVGLRWSFQIHVSELPALYWLILIGALLMFAVTNVTQVLNRVASVTFSPTYGLFTIAVSLLFVPAPFLFPLPAYGWSGTGYITGGMVATASFGVCGALLGLWIYRRGEPQPLPSQDKLNEASDSPVTSY